jgi:hypothetical protein
MRTKADIARLNSAMLTAHHYLPLWTT